MRTSRLEAFGDGVFAIAATLLVLEIRLPGEEVGPGLLDLWPSYFAYATSFLTIGIMWVNHHAILELVREADRRFLFLNLFLLMCIAFVPFPTTLLADHLGHEGAPEAAVAYGLSLAVTAVFFNAVWHYAAAGRRLLRENVSAREVRGITRSYAGARSCTPVRDSSGWRARRPPPRSSPPSRSFTCRPRSGPGTSRRSLREPGAARLAADEGHERAGDHHGRHEGQ